MLIPAGILRIMCCVLHRTWPEVNDEDKSLPVHSAAWTRAAILDRARSKYVLPLERRSIETISSKQQFAESRSRIQRRSLGFTTASASQASITRKTAILGLDGNRIVASSVGRPPVVDGISESPSRAVSASGRSEGSSMDMTGHRCHVVGTRLSHPTVGCQDPL